MLFAARTTALAAMAAVSFPAVALAQSAADRELRAAESAIAAKRWDDALAALERAYMVEKDPYFLYRRILVLEQMGEHALALEVLRENRATLLESDRVNDLVVVEERLQSAGATVEVANDKSTAPPASNPWPVISLAAGGAALVGGVVLLAVAQTKMASLHCPYDAPPCAPSPSQVEYDRRVDQARTFRTLGAILIPVGVIGVGVGVGALLLSGDTSSASDVALHISPTQVAITVRF